MSKVPDLSDEQAARYWWNLCGEKDNKIAALGLSLLKKHWSCCPDNSCDGDCKSWPDAKTLALEYCKPEISALTAEVAALKKAFEYFSCPECRCGWFRMGGRNHAENILECKHCGWEGPRKDGESERFWRTQDLPAQDGQPLNPWSNRRNRDEL